MAEVKNAPRGIAGLRVTRADVDTPLFRKLVAALKDERDMLREKNDHAQDIAATTLLRGQLSCVKSILARTDEVGPESRQSEPIGPESALSARTAAGFPQGF